MLGAAALTLAMTGPGALALDRVLPIERRLQVGGRPTLASQRG
jgi:hypothetical protein